MNLDLIKKLIKLANNNPNDNEANLAARKVCKMLNDYSFNGQSTTKTEPTKNYTPRQKQSDFWEDFVKSSGSSWGEGSWGPPKKETYNPQTRTHSSGETDESRHYHNYYGDIADPFRYGNIKRNIKCSKCNEVKETRFRGPESIWVCMDCRGKEYQK